MKSYQFFTNDGRGGTMLCDDETLEDAVTELTRRFEGVIKIQLGKEVWEAPIPASRETKPDNTVPPNTTDNLGVMDQSAKTAANTEESK